MIYKDQILKVGNNEISKYPELRYFVFQVLYDLHYPPVNKNMLNNMLDICEVRENILVSKNLTKNIYRMRW